MMTIRDGYPLDVPVDDGRLLLLLMMVMTMIVMMVVIASFEYILEHRVQ